MLMATEKQEQVALREKWHEDLRRKRNFGNGEHETEWGLHGKSQQGGPQREVCYYWAWPRATHDTRLGNVTRKCWWKWFSWPTDWNTFCIIRMLSGACHSKQNATGTKQLGHRLPINGHLDQYLMTGAQRCFQSWMTGLLKSRILKQDYSLVYNKCLHKQMD